MSALGRDRISFEIKCVPPLTRALATATAVVVMLTRSQMRPRPASLSRHRARPGWGASVNAFGEVLFGRLHGATYESDGGFIREDAVCQGLPSDLEAHA